MGGSDPAAGPSEMTSAENTSPVFELNIALQDLQKYNLFFFPSLSCCPDRDCPILY